LHKNLEKKTIRDADRHKNNKKINPYSFVMLSQSKLLKVS
jgi:hypothetical protein